MKKKTPNLPITYLLFTKRGRIGRRTFWNAQLFIWLSFYVLYNLIELSLGYQWTLIVYPFLYWALICTAAKRLHDRNKTALFLVLTLIPILGPMWLFFQMALGRGKKKANKYGSPPGQAEDYFVNPDAEKIEHLKSTHHIVNDVTQLNPIIVSAYKKPASIEELRSLVTASKIPLSVGGGRFSMGGQTAGTETLHLDLRALNEIETFSAKDKTITVQCGVRWCDIQKHIDPFELSLKIMQSYANFTVGGSLSVNAHGRYMGLGPLILSVLSIDVLLIDGTIVTASPTENGELFYGVIGGYNALGIIVRAKLQLSDNVKMLRISKRMKLEEFPTYFEKQIRENKDAVMHNTNIFPPSYSNINAVTWIKTDKKPTIKARLLPLKDSYPIERYFLWSFTERRLGKWKREFLIDPLIHLRKRVHWKNYEAGYDVAELEPKSRRKSTYVLREYFVPVEKFAEFTPKMIEIFKRHRVNVVNVSIRHAYPDSGSLLAWAPVEMYAFVVYYKQRTRENAKSRVAVWSREMIDAVLSVGGTYYLPYQIFERHDQFHQAYPRAKEFFDLKRKYDPEGKFRNQLWDKLYYKKETAMHTETKSEFQKIMSTPKGSDDLYRFLQIIFHLFPEDRFHQLIKDACEKYSTDEEIYREVQKKLPEIKPFLSEFSYSLPSLKKQKRVMTGQTLELLEGKKIINGYLEIGSTGRYISELRKHVKVQGTIYLQNDIAPGNGIGDFFERGQFSKIGTFHHLDYEAISPQQIADESIELITCFIGLHHCPEEKLKAYLQSIHRILKPGGKILIRDHDCGTDYMNTFASLVHTVFNLGLKESWDFNKKEYRKFRSADEWSKVLQEHGFYDSGKRILQDKDPSLNTLMCFKKSS